MLMPKHSLTRNVSTYALILLIVVIALLGFVLIDVLSMKDVAGFFLALFGTFFGALFAFRLNEYKEETKISKEQKEALNRAIFILSRQDNVIQNIAKHLDTYKTDFDKAYKLPTILTAPYTDLAQNFQDIYFLLETNNPNVLMRLSIEQECFDVTLECLRARNNFWVNEYQPELKRLTERGMKLTPEQFPAALDVRINSEAISTAKSLYSNVQESSKSIPTMRDELLIVAREVFPGERFITFS